MAAILDLIGITSVIFIYRSPRCYLPSVMSIGLSVQGKERKIDFKDGHLGFWIGTILAIFDVHVTTMLPTKFQVSWPFGSGKEAKIDLKFCRHGGHLGFPIRAILAIFDKQVTRMLPSYIWTTSYSNVSYRVTNQLALWKQEKKRPSRISDKNDFSTFIYKSTWCFLPIYKSIVPSVQVKKRKIDF